MSLRKKLHFFAGLCSLSDPWLPVDMHRGKRAYLQKAEHSEEQKSVCAGELQEEALQAQAGLWRTPLEYALITGNAFTFCRHESMLSHERNKAFSLECLTIQHPACTVHQIDSEGWFSPAQIDFTFCFLLITVVAIRSWAWNSGHAGRWYILFGAKSNFFFFFHIAQQL